MFVKTDLGTCMICGYEQDPEYIEYVKKAQAKHDLKCAQLKYVTHGITSWGGDWEYHNGRKFKE